MFTLKVTGCGPTAPPELPVKVAISEEDTAVDKSIVPGPLVTVTVPSKLVMFPRIGTPPVSPIGICPSVPAASHWITPVVAFPR